MLKTKFILILLSLITLIVCQSILPRSLGSFDAHKAAFCGVAVWETTGVDLLFTSFQAFRNGAVYHVPSIADVYQLPQTIKPLTVSSKLTWPNEVSQIPKQVLGFEALAVPEGFLVPGFQTGDVSIFNMTDPLNPIGPFQITQDKKDYFYHRVVWTDVDRDGLIDAISARAKQTSVSSDGQLVWLKNPGPSTALLGPWKESVITSGPDIFFILTTLPNDDGSDLEVIIATQFFSSKLAAYWSETNDWTNSTSIRSKVIDDTIGALFDLELTDLNKDGFFDLLVTNHESSAQNSSVFGFEIPIGSQWKTSNWPKHLIANGFVTRQPGSNQASPGAAHSFYQKTDQNSDKPLIVLGGDGSQEAYIICPLTQSSSDWTYNVTVLTNIGCTVGEVTAYDVDGDTWTEIFVPAYDKSFMEIFTYSP
eukprot:TRINITY_DN1484_c1_g4_i1.p1 TRINITY_DN1484_c1_g4~~TRINITY_DN1484_c1_g4_i1.p1  ORF type:complete len:421 (-),score=212.76 TRINITY_DN1484_c1_g4_i1:107-1369(-)